jgi:hypothetical protein
MRAPTMTLFGAARVAGYLTVSASVLSQTHAFAQTAPAPANAAADANTAPVVPTSATPAQPAPLVAEANAATAAGSGTDAAAAASSQSAPAGSAATASLQPSAISSTDAAVQDSAQVDAAADQVVEEVSDEAGKVNIYGFMDFTYAHLLSDRNQLNATTAPYPTFYVGNFNLYFSADLGKGWRTLAEARLTYLPDGAATFNYTTPTTTSSSGATFNGTRTSTGYSDYVDYGRTVKVGGVIIERAWVEYAAHPLLTVRLGQWLTPYGIWNVEHGSTVIIGTTRPFIVGAEMFPQHQTGIELYGTYGIDSTQVGYHLTLSNGRGPVDTYRDMDTNKAVGWRLWVQQDTSFGTFALGTSGYKGRYTDRGQVAVVNGTSLIYDYPINSEYKELSLALDLKWTWKGALVQSEAIMHDVGYENSTRPSVTATDGGANGWTPDSRAYGFYVIGGYRFPWLGVMPFFGGEYYSQNDANAAPGAAAFWGGINMRPTDRVVLKVQGVHSFYPTGNWVAIAKPKPMSSIITQVAWSF